MRENERVVGMTLMLGFTEMIAGNGRRYIDCGRRA